MAKWSFEPGHTAAEFFARHMMVSNVRGHFKDVHGTLSFDPKNPAGSSVEVVIDARKVWTGEESRDAHLRSVQIFSTLKISPRSLSAAIRSSCSARSIMA